VFFRIPLLLLPGTFVAGQSLPAILHDGERATLDLGGEWRAQSVSGLELHYPPAESGWFPQKIPGRTRVLDGPSVQSPWHTFIDRILAKDGQWIRKTGIAGWFERRFVYPEKLPPGKRVHLVFHGISHKTETWLNGTRLGASVQALTPLRYDITDTLKTGGAENRLFVALAAQEGLVDLETRTFVAPTAGAPSGIWGRVELQILPAIRIDDIFVKTSVKERRIEFETTLVNETRAPVTLLIDGLIVDKNNIPQTDLPPREIRLVPGETRTLALTKNWIAPVLWTPDTPALYHVRLRARDAARPDDETDRHTVRFGCREFEIRGRDFYLNGIRTVLLRDSTLYNMALPATPRILDELRSTAARPFNTIRLHHGLNNTAVLDLCDELGIMAIPESAWVNMSGKYSREHPHLWLPNVLDYTRALIRLHRNRPSVIMWSLTNESLWGTTDPTSMAIADQLIAAATEADPTRPLQGDAEVTWGGRLPVINIHYPESSIENSLRARYPHSGLVFPNDLYWLSQTSENSSWRARFAWDRPLVIGEYWHLTGDAESKSGYMGDTVFDWTEQKPGGRLRETFAAPLQMITDAYRVQGVAGLNPWIGDRAAIMPPVAVRPLDYFPNFFAGQTQARKVVVFNDTRTAWDRMHLLCTLRIGERTVWENKLPAQTAPGERTVMEIQIPIPYFPPSRPDAPAATRANLTVRLMHIHGERARLLHQYEETLFIMPRAALAPATGNIRLLDATGATAAALGKLGWAPPHTQTLSPQTLAGARLLIIGDDTEPAPAEQKLIAGFAAAGGSVLILRQDTRAPLASALPWLPAPDAAHVSTRAWPRAAAHPVLNGLDPRQLSWWRPDHLVSRKTFPKPSTGDYRLLLDTGGQFGLRWSPLLEIPHGQGLFILSQLNLVDRVDDEPLAGHLLERLIRAALAHRPRAAAPLRLLAAPGSKIPAALSAAGIDHTPAPADLASDAATGPILLADGLAPTPARLDSLRAHLAAGGNVWIHGYNKETLPAIASLFPFPPELEDYPKNIKTAALRIRDPLLDNLASFDFFWAKTNLGRLSQGAQPTAPLGGPALRIPSDDTTAIPLLNPALLVRIPVGPGHLLFDNLRWEDALVTETDKAARIVSTLAINQGARAAPRGEAPRYDNHFFVDLSTHANMGYHDRVADDGTGGWTDQGDNDMRFFLINHTGREGGLDTGMEVEAEIFPSRMEFAGQPFRLIDPARNSGHAIISLRGTGHGARLPDAIRAIPVARRADTLWLLHAASWASPKVHQNVARITVHYADATTAAIPIRYGLETSDWWTPVAVPNSRIAWTGRNLLHSPVGIYSTAWTNPHPDKEIRTLDIQAALGPTQFVLLAITGGARADANAPAAIPPNIATSAPVTPSTVATPPPANQGRLLGGWDFTRPDSKGAIPNLARNAPALRPAKTAPVPGTHDNRPALRFQDGASLTTPACPDIIPPDGAPFVLEIAFAAAARPVNSFAGLYQKFNYKKDGFRLLLNKRGQLILEINTASASMSASGSGSGSVSGFVQKTLASRTRIEPGRDYLARITFDGRHCTLHLDDKLDTLIETPPPLPSAARIQIGTASGRDYHFDGWLRHLTLHALQ
jgi:beta-galactosidase